MRGVGQYVTRLLCLNYLVLGTALAIIITLFRFNPSSALWEIRQEQLYLCTSRGWSTPRLALPSRSCSQRWPGSSVWLAFDLITL